MSGRVSASDVTQLEKGCEWTSHDVADPTSWTHVLTAPELAELESALAIARLQTDEVLDVRREDFPLPTLSVALDRVGEELINGRGFQRITGLPIKRLGFDDASWIYWGVGLHLGTPWPQNVKGHLLGDVKDQGKQVDDPTARGNELGGVAQPFHSDGSDLIGLMCLDPGIAGGESLMANAVTAHNLLVANEPELAAALYDGLPYDFRGEQRHGAAPFYHVPAFSRQQDRLFVRYIPPYIKASQRHADAPRLTSLQRAAMAALDQYIEDPDNQVEMTFAPGDMQFVNNYHVLHARRAYQDDAANGRVRWLKRLWLATDILGADQRPVRFQAAGATGHWSSSRTRA